ncbi:dihydrolipoamide acetyltransferase family protein [Fimbriiglobus ruber]|uniref:Dihydrolipoamide acetyltransferase component of pyruvate dehydrogenase complex n=1 Tax=Fimbriiglobus ruber TaxID=1908690 RepID=A0A225E0R1_9BACT|nr:dihydrolipoamide acetyltransferase family protein [Fimbriiglobus ruber]OWK41947.1 Dihydrolipoamide acetyltransferase component of pyruvate dehydrogenase complex [Fimbriiglobus ruber]
MPVTVTIPRLGWNMEQGVFVGWLKQDGDTVRPGDLLFKLEGEKATEEIETLDGGTLRIPPDAPQPGATVAVGAVIGYLLQPGEADLPAAPDAPPVPASTAAQPDEPPTSPSVRRMLRERGIDPRALPGTGPGGRVTAEDVVRASTTVPAARQEPAISPRARRVAAELNVDYTRVRGTGRTGRIRERDIRVAAAPKGPAPTMAAALTPARKTIAARMLESQRTTAPVTLHAHPDATNLVNLREQFKTVARTDSARPVPSYTDFLIKLVGAALEQHPLLASRWTDDGIRPPDAIHIGVAVDVDSGLVVPVVRDVPKLGLREVAAQSRELIDRARGSRLTTRDMQGGCFTITNLGAYGIDTFTPIINPPECAILGVGRIDRKPVVQDDKIVARDQIALSLTFDHRIVDGAPAARFLQTICQLIENPGPYLST